MTPYEIPLSPTPQKLTIDLAGVTRKLRVYWCKYSDCWCFDLLDGDGTERILGAPIVTGIDLLGQYAHLELGGHLIAQSCEDASMPPMLDNLGITGHLFFVTD